MADINPLGSLAPPVATETSPKQPTPVSGVKEALVGGAEEQSSSLALPNLQTLLRLRLQLVQLTELDSSITLLNTLASKYPPGNKIETRDAKEDARDKKSIERIANRKANQARIISQIEKLQKGGLPAAPDVSPENVTKIIKKQELYIDKLQQAVRRKIAWLTTRGSSIDEMITSVKKFADKLPESINVVDVGLVRRLLPQLEGETAIPDFIHTIASECYQAINLASELFEFAVDLALVQDAFYLRLALSQVTTCMQLKDTVVDVTEPTELSEIYDFVSKLNHVQSDQQTGIYYKTERMVYYPLEFMRRVAPVSDLDVALEKLRLYNGSLPTPKALADGWDVVRKFAKLYKVDVQLLLPPQATGLKGAKSSAKSRAAHTTPATLSPTTLDPTPSSPPRATQSGPSVSPAASSTVVASTPQSTTSDSPTPVGDQSTAAQMVATPGQGEVFRLRKQIIELRDLLACDSAVTMLLSNYKSTENELALRQTLQLADLYSNRGRALVGMLTMLRDLEALLATGAHTTDVPALSRQGVEKSMREMGLLTAQVRDVVTKKISQASAKDGSLDALSARIEHLRNARKSSVTYALRLRLFDENKTSTTAFTTFTHSLASKCYEISRLAFTSDVSNQEKAARQAKVAKVLHQGVLMSQVVDYMREHPDYLSIDLIGKTRSASEMVHVAECYRALMDVQLLGEGVVYGGIWRILESSLTFLLDYDANTIVDPQLAYGANINVVSVIKEVDPAILGFLKLYGLKEDVTTPDSISMTPGNPALDIQAAKQPQASATTKKPTALQTKLYFLHGVDPNDPMYSDSTGKTASAAIVSAPSGGAKQTTSSPGTSSTISQAPAALVSGVSKGATKVQLASQILAPQGGGGGARTTGGGKSGSVALVVPAPASTDSINVQEHAGVVFERLVSELFADVYELPEGKKKKEEEGDLLDVPAVPPPEDFLLNPQLSLARIQFQQRREVEEMLQTFPMNTATRAYLSNMVTTDSFRIDPEEHPGLSSYRPAELNLEIERRLRAEREREDQMYTRPTPSK